MQTWHRAEDRHPRGQSPSCGVGGGGKMLQGPCPPARLFRGPLALRAELPLPAAVTRPAVHPFLAFLPPRLLYLRLCLGQSTKVRVLSYRFLELTGSASSAGLELPAAGKSLPFPEVPLLGSLSLACEAGAQKGLIITSTAPVTEG